MCIETALKQIDGMRTYFDTYREEGFDSSVIIAKEIVAEMGVEPSFPVKRRVSRKKQFDEDDNDEAILEAEKDFKVNYFLIMVDKAATSLKIRFDELESFKNIFGFLMSSTALKSLDRSELKDRVTKFASAFSSGGSSDVDLNDLISELIVMQSTLPDRTMSAM